jgi:hypothetical protein
MIFRYLSVEFMGDDLPPTDWNVSAWGIRFAESSACISTRKMWNLPLACFLARIPTGVNTVECVLV